LNLPVNLKNIPLKKSIFILLLVTTLGCTKNTARSKFEGTWNGTYSSTIKNITPPDSDTGTLQIVVAANDSATGTLQSLHGGGPIIMKGKVDPTSGAISLSEYGQGDYGLIVFLEGLGGTLSAESGNGSLAFPWATTSYWQATKN
jgi:hypothetical protein